MANWQTMAQLQDISADLPRFTEAFSTLAQRLGLDIAPLNADHISLRCHQNATAERWRAGFEQCGTLLSENIINGRPICLFKLAEPVCVEIVLPGEPAQLNARALALLSDDGLSQPGISVKTSSPKGERERLPNPTMAVTDGNVTVKFHPWTIEEIVASEQAV